MGEKGVQRGATIDDIDWCWVGTRKQGGIGAAYTIYPVVSTISYLGRSHPEEGGGQGVVKIYMHTGLI
jgi:hypothetical protein